MGRKKRKVAAVEAADETADVVVGVVAAPPVVQGNRSSQEEKAPSSGYAMTSHSGEIIGEDIYISDGSESEEEYEVQLVGARMGLMRRGLHHPLVQPSKRQWTRPADAEQQHAEDKEEELAKLDPAERAARLLREEQQKAELEKQLARTRESEENAGRDSMLFSKRTAFDIRFDQIEDKPWLRGDISDFFNYGMSEEDWLEYSQQQLIIRQELIDARRQKRQPDPTIVPVTPREPTRASTDTTATVNKTAEADAEDHEGETNAIAAGPERPKETSASVGPNQPTQKNGGKKVAPAGVGGAWGAGAAPGSMLARLIEDQLRQGDKGVEDPGPYGNQPDERSSSNHHQAPEDRGAYGRQAEERASHGRQSEERGAYSRQQEDRGAHIHPPEDRGAFGHPPEDRRSYGHQQQVNPSYGRHAGGQPEAYSGYDNRSDQYYNEGGGYHGQQGGHYQEQPPPPPPQQQQHYRGRGGGRGHSRYNFGGRRSGEGRGGGADYYGGNSRQRQWDGGDRRRR